MTVSALHGRTKGDLPRHDWPEARRKHDADVFTVEKAKKLKWRQSEQEPRKRKPSKLNVQILKKAMPEVNDMKSPRADGIVAKDCHAIPDSRVSRMAHLSFFF